MGLEQERAGAVLPNILQRQLESAVYATLEPLLGKRRAHHVPAKSLELGAVVAMHDLLGVHAHAQRFGDSLLFGLAALVPAGGLARSAAEGHTQYRLTRALARDGNPKSCRLIASKQARLLETERLSFAGVERGGLVVPWAFAALLAKCCMQPTRSAPSDFSNLGSRRRL